MSFDVSQLDYFSFGAKRGSYAHSPIQGQQINPSIKLWMDVEPYIAPVNQNIVHG